MDDQRAAWKALQDLNDKRYNKIQDELQTAEGALKDSLLRELGEVQKLRYARVPWAEYMRNGECVVGRTYAIWSRNLQFGVFRGHADGGFVGIREKFGSEYLFTEYHYDVGMAFGTVEPWVDLEECPIKDLRENLESVCQHGRLVEWRQEHPTEHEGWWYHKDDGSRLPDGYKDDPHFAPMNQVLFDYLDDVRKRYSWETLMNTSRFKNEPDLWLPIP